LAFSSSLGIAWAEGCPKRRFGGVGGGADLRLASLSSGTISHSTGATGGALREAAPPPQTRPATYAAAAAAPSAALMAAQFVYVRRGGTIPPLEPLYLGPYQVLDNGPKVFRIAVGGKTEVVSVDRLKPHLGASAVTPSRPAARGRPPSNFQHRPGRSTLAGGHVAGGKSTTERAGNPPGVTARIHQLK